MFPKSYHNQNQKYRKHFWVFVSVVAIFFLGLWYTFGYTDYTIVLVHFVTLKEPQIVAFMPLNSLFPRICDGPVTCFSQLNVPDCTMWQFWAEALWRLYSFFDLLVQSYLFSWSFQIERPGGETILRKRCLKSTWSKREIQLSHCPRWMVVAADFQLNIAALITTSKKWKRTTCWA